MKVNEVINEDAWDAIKAAAPGGMGLGNYLQRSGGMLDPAQPRGVVKTLVGRALGAGPSHGISSNFQISRYQADWTKFVNSYEQGGEKLPNNNPAEFKKILDKWIKQKYGEDSNPSIALTKTDTKSVASYINSQILKGQATRATSQSQLQTGYAFPRPIRGRTKTSITDTQGHTYTYTFPAAGVAQGQWSYNGTAITRPEDIQILNRLHMLNPPAKNPRAPKAPAAAPATPATGTP